MKKNLFASMILGMLATGYAAVAADDVVFKEVKVLKVEGDVTVTLTDKGEAVPMQKDAVYPFGTTIKTGRASFADLELSPKNSFRILAGSTVTIQPNTKSPKLVSLKMKEGEIESNLGAFPKGFRYEVQTPLAICGAVGTSYIVKYVYTAKNEVQIQVIDNEGNVTIRSEGMKVEGSGLKPGQMLTVMLTKTDTGWVATASFTGAPGDGIILNLWGIRQEITIPTGSTTTTGTGTSTTVTTTTTTTTTTATVTVKVDLPPYINPLPDDTRIMAPGEEGGAPKWNPPTPLPPPTLQDLPTSVAEPL